MSFLRGSLPVLTITLLFLGAMSAFAKVIHVPKDYPTISQAISAANNGDTILVDPGTYNESINFGGKAIKVASVKGPKKTVIDGGGSSAVVAFTSGETATSILEGFTVQGASGGAGVEFSNSSGTLEKNYIMNNNNAGCPTGPGISTYFGSPVIKHNVIQNNGYLSCQSGGGAIAIDGASSVQILDNLIVSNAGSSAISLFAAGTPTIEDNIIANNDNSYGSGGAIGMVNESAALVVQNLMYGNKASSGTEINFLVPEGSQPPVFVNNTIVGGSGSTQGTAVYAGGFDDQVQFYNNLLIGQTDQNAVYCDNSYDQNPPTFTNSDAWAPSGTGFQDTCASESNQNGNISANPKFRNPSKQDYQVRKGSPVIGAGTTSAPDIPKKDLAGHPRIINGKIDIGAYEYQGRK
jgi:hypothetical protein